MRTLTEISIDSTDEQISKFCEEVPMMGLSSEMRQMYLDYATSLLASKQQQRLLNEQREYNNKQLFWSRVLAIATIAVAGATLLVLRFG